MLRIASIALLLSAVFAIKVERNNSVPSHSSGKVLAILEGFADLGHVESPMQIPELTIKGSFTVPTTARCIVIMVVQYMIIYTALAVCRTVQEFTGTGKGPVEAGLNAAAQTLTYGPMICVLFIACRMRVEFLSGGKGQPQIWVQNCMYAMTFSVLASALLVLFIPLVTGTPMPLKDDSCDLESPRASEFKSKTGFYVLSAMRYLILLGLYGGLIGVIVGTSTYLPPGASDLSKQPPPAPAVRCTMVLAVVFFATQLVIALCRSYCEYAGVEISELVGIINGAPAAVEFAPMLAIVFLSARMRALQHNSQPHVWAQNCMYAATCAMCFMTILSIIVPVCLPGAVKRCPKTKEVTFDVPRATLGYLLITLRFVCMLGFYCGVVGVIYSIFTFKAPSGPTLPVSTTVQCVVNLSCQFFFVYLVLNVCLTVKEVTGASIPLEKYKLYAALEACKKTLGFAPMLSILFVTTRMYALLITDRRGAPQAWVQDGMCMATWSLLISFLSCLIVGFVTDEVETDEDGNVVNKFSNQYVALLLVIIRYCSMLLLYGGIVTVVVGLFVMTPETANGSGSVPFLSDAVNATPLGEAPPGSPQMS